MASRNGYSRGGGRGGRGGGRGKYGTVTTKLFIGALPETCRRSDLMELFSEFGEVVECDIVKDYGFVHYAKEDEAKSAVAALHDQEFHGSKLRVELSTSKVRHQPGMGDKSTCYRCSKPGHWSKDCPDGPSRYGSDSRRGGGGKMGRDSHRSSDPYPYPAPPRDYFDSFRDRFPPPPGYERYGATAREEPQDRYSKWRPPSASEWFKGTEAPRPPPPPPPSSSYDRRAPSPSRDRYFDLFMEAYERRYRAERETMRNMPAIPPAPAPRPQLPDSCFKEDFSFSKVHEWK